MFVNFRRIGLNFRELITKLISSAVSDLGVRPTQGESYMRDEDGVGQLLKEEKKHFMDDPRKGACNFSKDTANSDSNLLYQSQSHENSLDEDDLERVVIEAAYLDDVIISASSEEEIGKLKRTFPKFLHSLEIISKTSVHGNIQEPSQLPSPGFINTAIILEESRFKRIVERNKKEDLKTVQVFTQKEVRKEVEWKANKSANSKDKPVSNAEQQSSQALTVKVGSDNAKNHGAGAQHPNKLKTFAESKKVSSQNTQHGTCDTIVESNDKIERKEDDSLPSEKTHSVVS